VLKELWHAARLVGFPVKNVLSTLVKPVAWLALIHTSAASTLKQVSGHGWLLWAFGA